MSNLSSFQTTDGTNHRLWENDTEEKLNNHINIEMSNFASYEALACFLDNANVGFKGLAKKFRQEADEELKHARDFIDYQNMRGGKVSRLDCEIVDLSEVQNANNVMLAAYKFALKLEQNTNLSLEKLHDTVNDNALCDKIESYLHEQHQIQYELNSIIQMLELGGVSFCAIHENELRSAN